MEEAARISGAGWFRTFGRIWLPLLAPYLVLIGLLNFNIAANTTAAVILLVSRETVTISVLILEWLQPGINLRSAAAVAQIMLGGITLTIAVAARHYASRLGIQRAGLGGR